MQIKILLLAAAVFALCSCHDTGIKALAIRQEQVVQVLFVANNQKCSVNLKNDMTQQSQDMSIGQNHGGLFSAVAYNLYQAYYPRLYADIRCESKSRFSSSKVTRVRVWVTTYDQAISETSNGWFFTMARDLGVSPPLKIDPTEQGDAQFNAFVQDLRRAQVDKSTAASNDCAMKGFGGCFLAEGCCSVGAQCCGAGAQCCAACADCAMVGELCDGCAGSGFGDPGAY